MPSASPERQRFSSSPDPRAHSVEVTPATSNTPAPAPRKARKRPAAVAADGGPRKRHKGSSKNVPGLKKRRDRPRAPRTKVKIARTPRGIDPDELPGSFSVSTSAACC
jgi:hypothetical protein